MQRWRRCFQHRWAGGTEAATSKPGAAERIRAVVGVHLRRLSHMEPAPTTGLADAALRAAMCNNRALTGTGASFHSVRREATTEARRALLRREARRKKWDL